MYLLILALEILEFEENTATVGGPDNGGMLTVVDVGTFADFQRVQNFQPVCRQQSQNFLFGNPAASTPALLGEGGVSRDAY